MPLVPAKCTSCGATLTLDPSQDAALCPFCNTPFIVEKAINNYTTVNNYNTTQNITAETVIMQNSRQEELYQAAESLLSLKSESRAYDKFKELSSEFPGDWRGWWGLYKIDIKRLVFFVHPSQVLESFRNALKLVPSEKASELRQSVQNDISDLRHQIEEHQRNIEHLQALCQKEDLLMNDLLTSSTEALEYEAAEAHYSELCSITAALKEAASKHEFVDASILGFQLLPSIVMRKINAQAIEANKKYYQAEAEEKRYRTHVLYSAQGRYAQKKEDLMIKHDKAIASLQERIIAYRALQQKPRICIEGIERELQK